MRRRLYKTDQKKRNFINQIKTYIILLFALHYWCGICSYQCCKYPWYSGNPAPRIILLRYFAMSLPNYDVCVLNSVLNSIIALRAAFIWVCTKSISSSMIIIILGRNGIHFTWVAATYRGEARYLCINASPTKLFLTWVSLEWISNWEGISASTKLWQYQLLLMKTFATYSQPLYKWPPST